jgi:hypothetical protein
MIDTSGKPLASVIESTFDYYFVNIIYVSIFGRLSSSYLRGEFEDGHERADSP